MSPITLPVVLLVAYVTLLSGYLAACKPDPAAPICRAVQH